MNKEILQKYNIKAKKALGQNFLVNEDIVQEIADTLEISGKNILEVGPGYGALTEKIIEKKPKSLNLIELDNDMIDILEKRIKNNDFNLDLIDFKIHNIDILKYEPEYLDYSVIANIPYYITSPILRHFLYNIKNKPQNMLILMQKDVGDKIISGQVFGKKQKVKSSVLSMFVAKKAYVHEVIVVSNQNFIPKPKIQSSVLFFELHNNFSFLDDKKFLEIIKLGFKESRKMLLKNLSNSGFDKEYLKNIFLELNIDEKVRAEDLDISIWCQLALKINK